MPYFLKKGNIVFKKDNNIFRFGYNPELSTSIFKTHSWVNVTDAPGKTVHIDQNRFYFANNLSKKIEVYDANTLMLLNEISLVNIPYAVNSSPVNNAIYVGYKSSLEIYDYVTYELLSTKPFAANYIDVDESNGLISTNNAIRDLTTFSVLTTLPGVNIVKIDLLANRFIGAVYAPSPTNAVKIFDSSSFDLIETLSQSQIGYASSRISGIDIGNGTILIQSGNLATLAYNNPGAGVISSEGLSGWYPRGVAFDPYRNRIFSAFYGNATSMNVYLRLYK